MDKSEILRSVYESEDYEVKWLSEGKPTELFREEYTMTWVFDKLESGDYDVDENREYTLHIECEEKFYVNDEPSKILGDREVYTLEMLFKYNEEETPVVELEVN
jgi:hypothetical protein